MLSKPATRLTALHLATINLATVGARPRAATLQILLLSILAFAVTAATPVLAHDPLATPNHAHHHQHHRAPTVPAAQHQPRDTPQPHPLHHPQNAPQTFKPARATSNLVADNPAADHPAAATDHTIQPNHSAVSLAPVETSPEQQAGPRQTDQQALDQAITVARQQVSAFQRSGDDQYLEQAQARLDPFLQSTRRPPALLIAAAFVAQARHHFNPARALIQEALAQQRWNDEAWLLLAAVELVSGETAAAEHACQQLHATPPLVTLTCQARVALARGQHEAAYPRLQRVLDIAPQTIPANWRAWALSVSGDLAVANQHPEQAIEHYQHALQQVERTQVRAALVDVYIERGQYQAAQAALAGGHQALPLLVRRLIVAKAQGRLNAFSDTVRRIDEEFTRWIADDDDLHAREMARFYLDVLPRPSLAKRLAIINGKLQREPEDLRLIQRTAGSSVVIETAPTH